MKKVGAKGNLRNVVPGTRSLLDTSIDRSTRLGTERAAVEDLNPK